MFCNVVVVAVVVAVVAAAVAVVVVYSVMQSRQCSVVLCNVVWL